MKFKKFLFILLALLVVFIGFTLTNTFLTASKQPTIVPSSVELDENAAIEKFSKALTYKTISYQEREKFDLQEFDKFISFLMDSYPTVHENLELETINDYALVYKWEGTNPNTKPIGLTSHYDVVPVLSGTEGNWEKDPFSGAIQDGLIWGRGTLDDKIGVIGILEAAEYLLKEGFTPSRDIYFMFGFDEEIGGELGAKAIADSLKQRGIQFDFVLDEGGAIVENMVPGVDQPVGVVGISEKGSATAELTIKGSGGHSSQPKDRTNIGRIASAIAALEETQFEGKLRGPGNDLFEFVAPEMSFGMKYVFSNKIIFKSIIEQILLKEPATAALIRTTIAPTIFHAGEQYNALPEEATAIINLRLMPGDSLEDVKEFIVKTIDDDGITVTVTGSESSSVSSTDGPQFKAIQLAARNVYNDAIIAPYLMFAGSDAKHYDIISDNTYRFLPVQITSEDLNRMHGTNEHISSENYINAIKFYVEIMKVTNQ
ncbi:M20 family peptidase [Ureibacillus chungkukjangi]|uniref:M20 family peptidase n=1 Tax=Ureibacillus chungkukjangi TaxID=1202712 RepID=UPI00203B7939|nr:M20 family peptidase [Ureibacillus chungkukjangi]MCM3388462.1 M20 family peptidase [Ureibacillus chungkukjangi]